MTDPTSGETKFWDLAEPFLLRPEVSRSTMMGFPCLRVDGDGRLVREWLDSQAAGGLVAWDATTDTYALSAEAVLALADDSSPAFVARGMNAFASMFVDMDKIADAFRGDGALSWGDHHPCLFPRSPSSECSSIATSLATTHRQQRLMEERGGASAVHGSRPTTQSVRAP